jgi:hypothetical protein
MPIVTILGIPPGTPKLHELRSTVQWAIAANDQLGLTENQVSVFFPTDLLPTEKCELIAVVHGLFKKPQRTPKVRQQLATATGLVIKQFAELNAIPYVLIEVLKEPHTDTWLHFKISTALVPSTSGTNFFSQDNDFSMDSRAERSAVPPFLPKEGEYSNTYPFSPMKRLFSDDDILREIEADLLHWNIFRTQAEELVRDQGWNEKDEDFWYQIEEVKKWKNAYGMKKTSGRWKNPCQVSGRKWNIPILCNESRSILLILARKEICTL